MRTLADLMQMVTDAVDAALAAGQFVKKEWVPTTIIKEWDVRGADADLAMMCSREHIKTIVGAYIRGIKKDAEDDATPEQLRLPGFERLQKFYAIERDGEHGLVAIEQMTVDEGRSKESEHRAMARGHDLHADELRAYFDEVEQRARDHSAKPGIKQATPRAQAISEKKGGGQ